MPTRVVSSAATGIATSGSYNCDPQTDDTITLLVDWQSIKSRNHKGTAVYTASWTALSLAYSLPSIGIIWPKRYQDR